MSWLPLGQTIGVQGSVTADGNTGILGPFAAGDWLVSVHGMLVHTSAVEVALEVTFGLTFSSEVSVSNLNASTPLVLGAHRAFSGARIPIIIQQVGQRSSSVLMRLPVGRLVRNGPWWVLAWMRPNSTSVIGTFCVEALTWVGDGGVSGGGAAGVAGGNVLEDLRRGGAEASGTVAGA